MGWAGVFPPVHIVWQQTAGTVFKQLGQMCRQDQITSDPHICNESSPRFISHTTPGLLYILIPSSLDTESDFRYALTTVNCIPWLSQHLFRKLLIGKTQLILSSRGGGGGNWKIKKRGEVRDFDVPGSTVIAQRGSSEICLCEKHTQRLADFSAESFFFFQRCERRELSSPSEM